MKKPMKITFWLAGIFLLLLLVAGYLAPRFINSDLIKRKIERSASEKVGGRVAFKDMDLSLFPRPKTTIYHGEISAAPVQGTVESLTVYPEVFPLFTGRFKVAELLIASPEVTLVLPVQQKKDPAPRPSPLRFPRVLR